MLPTLDVFGLSVPTFGLMMMCGMVAAFVLLRFTRRIIRFTEDQVLSCALWTILLGFLGAKVLYWIVEFDQVLADPHYLIETLRTGFVFYGALLGGLLGVGIYALYQKLPFFGFVDLLVPSLSLAHAFGRIGCFLAGCCYGMACESPISVVFPAGSAAPAGVPLLPTQLMESVFLFLLSAALILIMKRRKPFGTVTGWYLVCYGVWRFIIEFFRNDDRGAIGALSTSQFIGIFIVLGGAALLLLIKFGVLRRFELPPPQSGEPADAAVAEEARLPDEPDEPDEPAEPEAPVPADKPEA